MSDFDWNKEKNEGLKSERNISFEDIVEAVSVGNLLKIIDHPNNDKYPKQKIMFVNVNNYVYLVPFVKSKNGYFLKTIIPSSKFTKQLLVKKEK